MDPRAIICWLVRVCWLVMINTAHLGAWSYRRQFLDRTAASALEALRRVVGVHGTHPPAPLSLLARTTNFSWEDFEALQAEKKVVGMSAMRGSVHLLPTEFGAPVIAVANWGEAQIEKRLGSDKSDPRTFSELRRDLLPLLAEPVAGSGIRETLGINDREYLAIRLMSRNGDVVRLSTHPRADRLRYVATAAWLGEPFEEMSAEEGLTWLAGAYFDAFGPARLKDFAWWAGCSQRDARAAIDAAGLEEIEPDLLLPRSLRDAFRAVEPLDHEAIAILPKWDSYTMGYAPDGRQRLVDDRHLPFAYTTTETKQGATTGDGLPLILVGGRAVAFWRHRFAGAKMSVVVSPFPGETVQDRALSPRFEEAADLLGCSRLELTIEG